MAYHYFAFVVRQGANPNANGKIPCDCWYYVSGVDQYQMADGDYDDEFWKSPMHRFPRAGQDSPPQVPLSPGDHVGVAIIDVPPYRTILTDVPAPAVRCGDGSEPFDQSAFTAFLYLNDPHDGNHKWKTRSQAVWVTPVVPVTSTDLTNDAFSWDLSAAAEIADNTDQGAETHEWDLDPKVCVGAGCGGGG